MTLDVAISTYKPEGILRVEKILPPTRPQVRYVVSWQEHGNTSVPESLLNRNDVEIHRLDEKGLSRNRNNALQHCKGDIVLIADDDVIFTDDFAQTILNVYEKNPTVDLATFKVDYTSNPKKYPREDCILGLPLPKDYFVASIEMSFRRDRLKEIRFSPALGLGSPKLQAGEDEYFLYQAIKGGLRCYFVNKIIASHPAPTTGNKVTLGILRAQGFIIKIYYPVSFLLRIPLKAYRVAGKKRVSFFKTLYHLVRGAIVPQSKIN